MASGNSYISLLTAELLTFQHVNFSGKFEVFHDLHIRLQRKLDPYQYNSQEDVRHLRAVPETSLPI